MGEAALAATEQQQQQQRNSAAAGNSGGGAAVERQGQGPGAGAAEGAAECGQPVAFLHYRFEEEAGEAVLYCYEIQVAEAVQVGGGCWRGCWRGCLLGLRHCCGSVAGQPTRMLRFCGHGRQHYCA